MITAKTLTLYKSQVRKLDTMPAKRLMLARFLREKRMARKAIIKGHAIKL